jgi:hypothetical protein
MKIQPKISKSHFSFGGRCAGPCAAQQNFPVILFSFGIKKEVAQL